MVKRNIIGKPIKQIRQLKGFTQERIVARLNIQGIEIDQTMISKIEDQVRGLHDYEVQAFAIALSVSIEDLFINII